MSEIIQRSTDLILPITVGKPTKPENVFLGVPTHDGRLSIGTVKGSVSQTSRKRTVLFFPSHYTNLDCNYNMCLCNALNIRKTEGVRWFAMLHSDIEPELWWIDILIDEAEKHGADIMSACPPLKDMRGLTSVAISDPANRWVHYCRLSQHQIWHADFPETFDTDTVVTAIRNLPSPYGLPIPEGAKLLINTGCMVMRVDRPWSETIHFHKDDDIMWMDDVWQPVTWTEDYMLSLDLHAVGARVMATRKVNLGHKGDYTFWSNDVWGQDVDVDTLTANAMMRREREERLAADLAAAERAELAEVEVKV